MSWDIVLADELPVGEGHDECAHGEVYLRIPRGELVAWAKRILEAHERSAGEASTQLITLHTGSAWHRRLS